jgi:hypothetical protein
MALRPPPTGRIAAGIFPINGPLPDAGGEHRPDLNDHDEASVWGYALFDEPAPGRWRR